MLGEELNISNVDSSSYIYGPRQRYVVWLQGCTLACPGCWNVDMWPHKEKQLIHREKLLNDILSTSGIEGVTLLGGEPLQQIDNVQWLIESLKASNFGVMLYTGYERSEIEANEAYSRSLNYVDILVSGRYVQEKRNTGLLWRGSSNQEVTFLSDRYANYEVQEQNQVEIEIDEFGRETILGFPDEKLINAILVT